MSWWEGVQGDTASLRSGAHACSEGQRDAVKTKRSLRGLAIGLAAAATIGSTMVWWARSDVHRADRRQIQALLRELERDLNDKRLFEIFRHLAQGDPNAPEPEQREHDLKDSLWELSRIEELRFSETGIAFSDEGAMVQTVVTGFVESPSGFRERTSSRILLKLVKESAEWKVASKRPEGAVHSLSPFRSIGRAGTTDTER